jgi:teichuronic acid exporter
VNIKDKNFRSVFLSGLRWSALKRFGQAFLSVVVIIIMARLLDPSDFGLVAMATVFTGISNVFTELGTGEALIRKKNPTNDFISSIFWLNTSLAIFVCLILSVIASSVANLYDQDVIEILIYVLSIEIFLSGINRVSHALLEKNMRFKAIAFAQIVSQICGAAVGISMAFLGYGLWSLVFLGISSQLIYVIIVNLALRWKPSVTFNFDHIKSIFSFSSYLTLVKILDHIQRRSEIFVVAYFMGSHLGGVYSQSHNLLRKPVKLIGGFMAPVLFSTMSSLTEDMERIKSLYLKSIQSFAMIYIPISTILVLYSEPFVLFILGEKWFEMAQIMPVFGFMLLFASMHKCNTIALKSVGRVDLLFRMYVIFVIASITGCVIGAQFGIFWVAVSMLITTFFLFLASTFISIKVIQIEFLLYIKQISILIIYGLLMLSSGYVFNIFLSGYIASSSIFSGILGFLVCSLVYISALYLRPVPSWNYFIELLNIKKS